MSVVNFTDPGYFMVTFISDPISKLKLLADVNTSVRPDRTIEGKMVLKCDICSFINTLQISSKKMRDKREGGKDKMERKSGPSDVSQIIQTIISSRLISCSSSVRACH